jgi:hypothetical protein
MKNTFGKTKRVFAICARKCFHHVFESMRKGSAEKVDSYFNAIPQKAIAAGELDPRQELIG